MTKKVFDNSAEMWLAIGAIFCLIAAFVLIELHESKGGGKLIHCCKCEGVDKCK